MIPVVLIGRADPVRVPDAEVRRAAEPVPFAVRLAGVPACVVLLRLGASPLPCDALARLLSAMAILLQLAGPTAAK